MVIKQSVNKIKISRLYQYLSRTMDSTVFFVSQIIIIFLLRTQRWYKPMHVA